MFLKNYDRQQWPAGKSKKKRLKKVPKKEREKKEREFIGLVDKVIS